jgi:hypothetical protein
MKQEYTLQYTQRADLWPLEALRCFKWRIFLDFFGEKLSLSYKPDAFWKKR